MTYKIFDRHDGLFKHCQFKNEESIDNSLIDNFIADFYTYDKHTEVLFVHITNKKNTKSIIKNGLIYQRNSDNHLGDGNYCFVYNPKSKLNYNDFYNFVSLVLKNSEEFSLIFGEYNGMIRYCFKGLEGHEGYTLLLDDIPSKDILKTIDLDSLKDISISEIEDTILDNLFFLEKSL